MTLREWWNAKGRAVEQANARMAQTRHKQVLSGVRRLQGLSDDELIAAASPRSSLSYPHEEMEMQRRLKDSIEALTAARMPGGMCVYVASVVFSASYACTRAASGTSLQPFRNAYSGCGYDSAGREAQG